MTGKNDLEYITSCCDGSSRITLVMRFIMLTFSVGSPDVAVDVGNADVDRGN